MIASPEVSEMQKGTHDSGYINFNTKPQDSSTQHKVLLYKEGRVTVPMHNLEKHEAVGYKVCPLPHLLQHTFLHQKEEITLMSPENSTAAPPAKRYKADPTLRT